MNSQKTPHTSPFQASYGVSFMSTSTEIDRVIKGFYCTCNEGNRTERLLDGNLGDGGQVEMGVVGHDDGTKQDGHDTCNQGK